jgi:hypothetical protein
METKPLLVALPDDVAAEAVRAGCATWALPHRDVANVALVALSTWGSVVGVLQTPKTLSEFRDFIYGCVGRRNEDLLIKVAKKGKYIEVTISSDLPRPAIDALLSQVLDGESS